MNRNDDETWYLVLMFEKKKALGKAVQNQQVLASDEKSDFALNVADSPPFKEAILFLVSTAI